jgi:hypothetical protein
MFNFKLRTWTAPHWLTVGVATIGGAIGGALVTYVESIPSAELLKDLTTKAGLAALEQGALNVGVAAALAAFVGVAKQILPPAEQATQNAFVRGQAK